MKIVLAYSGGLDTSVNLKWLIEKYKAEVISVCVDLGQEEETSGIKEKARKTGASKCFLVDAVDEFASDFIYPMIQAGAIYEGQYFLGTSIARPLIAKAQVEIARREGANAVAHGATGKGNDQCRFELTYAALAPDLNVIAPWREWEFKGREDLLNYAHKHGIPVTATKAKPYSSDRNLLHISFESGILEDPWAAPPDDMFLLSVAPEKAPDKAEIIEVEFEKGNAVGLKTGTGAMKYLKPSAMMRELNKLGGRHGVGRVDMVENRFVGMKSRGVYETPGGSILHFAHRQVETITMDREVMHLRDSLIPRYAELVYYGFWFAPERLALQAFVTESQRNVSGTARLKLYKGNIITQGRKSPLSLYQPKIATMEDDAGAYNQADAGGFLRLQGLRIRAWSTIQGKTGNQRKGAKKRVRNH
ncbi:argininosuccinate synthase [Candidatus Sumerlaeota bacterium]|nr:argininosuccinate synthase [Candidatus Sumerlaeota bacterium]